MALKLTRPELLRERGFINGNWVQAGSGETFPVVNPANGEHLANVPDMGADDTRRAIDHAAAAWPAWRSTVAKERANILRKWYNLIMEHQEDLARLMTAEQGKPLLNPGAR